MAINYRECPDCGSENTIKIVYGEPGRATYIKAEAGLIKLGEGCAVSDSPEFFCSDCEYEWNRKQAADAAYCAIKEIKASVSRYSGGYYSAVVDFIHPQIVWRHGGNEMEDEEFYKSIREVTASRFADQLKEVHLLDWDAVYTKPDMCGGMHWSLEITTGEKTIYKTGDNQVPAEWETFCHMIQEISCKSFE